MVSSSRQEPQFWRNCADGWQSFCLIYHSLGLSLTLINPLLVTRVLDEADLGEADPAHALHQVQPPGVGAGGDQQVVAEQEALSDRLPVWPLSPHHRQPTPPPSPRLLAQNLSTCCHNIQI